MKISRNYFSRAIEALWKNKDTSMLVGEALE